MMQGIQYRPIPERKDVTEQIERWKREDAEKDRRLREEREKRKKETAVSSQ